ncbi:Integral membrane protein (Ytp1) [Rasamsonia emersonii CBS 393.64]|uniref:Integral membrane protein (Ytp1) n=1 Tax=Rasamsonia emersonii (strain ATCC 16479 / CBS 393.64 / IMI 116815) TaxID=1408163 RepID=A0A0F4YVP8_RASE3|nr:Integral membrane protein (Ytp1) [Rasamsonia emersonii CBS 393.64]KKA21931.1 Integral membrane protein (Ytp1) [Rasamsonia emersonii CBS 393.64]
MTMRSLALPLALLLARQVSAHGGHEAVPEGQAISADPIIIRSRWHVPVQVVGTVVAVLAYFLGHAHKGRQFAKNIHASFANSLMLMMVLQVVLGVYLKLHLSKGIHGRIRRFIVICHGVIGKLMPVVSWVQMLFGGITALGFCRGDHLGQCLAHFIMGSAFIAYGILLTILLLVGQYWLRRTGRSQEFFDSLVIAAWGCVNTFTEHRWGGPWVHNDLQHTTMGIVWWCAGLLGIWLSRKRNGRPKRNLVPAIVILLTGYAMSAHPQTLHLSTMVHTVFGYTLMAAGAARIIEISFVLKDRSTLSPDGSDPHSFQYLPPFLLYASGFLFMGATEEQMKLLTDANITHVSYILILYSIAFLLFLFVNVLLHIYAVHAFPDSATVSHAHRRAAASGAAGSARPKPHRSESSVSSFTNVNGGFSRLANGHARTRSEAQQIQEAEEYELQGLISEEDDNEEVGKKAGGDEENPLIAKETGTRA